MKMQQEQAANITRVQLRCSSFTRLKITDTVGTQFASAVQVNCQHSIDPMIFQIRCSLAR